MKTIIQQIVAESAKKFFEYFEEHGVRALSDMTEALKQISDEMAREILSAFITSADDAIRGAREERMGDRVKIRESRVPRELFTALGPFTYNRTYFDTPDGRKYMLDDILGVEAYERIDADVSAALVNAAAHNSYRRSADTVTGGRISGQSVRNKALNTGEVVYAPEKAETTPETLHIFADEDHASLQNGKNTIIPLVTVCSGKIPVCEGRNALIDPFHIHGYGIKPEELWEYAYALCAEKYDMGRVNEVYIYGDGASWIKMAFDVFPGAIYTLDKFHFKKRIRGLLSGEGCSAFSFPIHAAIQRNDRASFDKAVQNMIGALEARALEGKEKARRIKNVKGHSAYILNHWEAIQNMKLPGSIGSCTEALISHALSERFSRNPMGWSEAGLSKMAMIRVFVLNGGRVKPADVTAWKRNPDKGSVIERHEKYEAIATRQREDILKDAKNWRWFETDNLISGKRTGTSVALDALGRTRKIS